MKKHCFAFTAKLIALIAVVALGISFGIPSAMSQEDMKEIKAEAFKEHTRPPAVFVHDEHNTKANIEDCETCHHGKDEATGKQDKEDNTAGTPCADCHAVNNPTGTPLMRAYHQQCITCHEEKKAGPTYCGGCHKK